jgi:CDGSH iron-sulfur domain-containing protein 3
VNRFLKPSGIKMTWTERYNFTYEPKAVVSQYSPYCVKVEANKSYEYCSCGLSQTQPWVDGACKCSTGTDGFRPIEYRSQMSGFKLLCGCKHCGYKPEFDGGCYLKFVEDFPLKGALYTFAAWFTAGTIISYSFHP